MEKAERYPGIRGETLEKKESYFGCWEDGSWEVEFNSDADNTRKGLIS